jgi:protein TonB
MDWPTMLSTRCRTRVVVAAAAVIGVALSAIVGAANQRLKVGGPVKPPVKVFDVKPVYPEDARAARIQGVVILGIVIGQDGSVIETQVLRSIPALDQAAIDAVSQWLYEPTLLNGEPVEIEMNVAINFTPQ